MLPKNTFHISFIFTKKERENFVLKPHFSSNVVSGEWHFGKAATIIKLLLKLLRINNKILVDIFFTFSVSSLVSLSSLLSI